ncbi:MAG TPA: SRPBCC domain-containing protein [Pyrinomonadaceae bacterium]
MTTASTAQYKETDIVITREFAAPRQLVWDVWTEPKHIEKWFGPKGFTTRVDALDFKVGGRSSYVMIGPDGTEYPSAGVFKEIVPIEKIVSTDEWGEGYEEMAAEKKLDLPQGMILTALFDDLGERTKLTLITSHPTLEDKKKHEAMGVVDGWNSSLDKMDEYLAEIQ